MSLTFVSNPARSRIEQAAAQFQADRIMRDRQAEMAAERARVEFLAREREYAAAVRKVAPANLPAWRVILSEVADAYGFTVGDLVGSSRAALIVRARHEAMFRMRAEVIGGNGRPMSLPMIGKRMGGRDHTTVMHGIRKHADRYGLAVPRFQALPPKRNYAEKYPAALIEQVCAMWGVLPPRKVSEIVGLRDSNVVHRIWQRYHIGPHLPKIRRHPRAFIEIIRAESRHLGPVAIGRKFGISHTLVRRFWKLSDEEVRGRL